MKIIVFFLFNSASTGPILYIFGNKASNWTDKKVGWYWTCVRACTVGHWQSTECFGHNTAADNITLRKFQFFHNRYQFVKTTQYRPRSSKCLKSYFDRQNIFGIFSKMFTYTYFMHVGNHFRDNIEKVQSKKWILDIGGLTRALGTIFFKT